MAKATEDKPARKHLNLAQKRARKSAELCTFLDAYKRPPKKAWSLTTDGMKETGLITYGVYRQKNLTD